MPSPAAKFYIYFQAKCGQDRRVWTRDSVRSYPTLQSASVQAQKLRPAFAAAYGPDEVAIALVLIDTPRPEIQIGAGQDFTIWYL